VDTVGIRLNTGYKGESPGGTREPEVRSSGCQEPLKPQLLAPVSEDPLTGEQFVIPPVTLRRNVSWTLGGNIIYACSQWGLLVVLAKIGNSTMVGQFALGLAICAPVFMLTNLQLRSVEATDATHQYRFSDYFGLRIVATVLGLLFIFVLLFFTNYEPETKFVVASLGCAKAVESFSDVVYGFIQQHEQMAKIALSMIFKGVGSVVVLAATLHASHSLVQGCLGIAIWWTAVFLLYDSLVCRYMLRHVESARHPFFPSWNLHKLWRLTALAFPLGIHTLLISLTTNIPRYAVHKYLGTASLGVFASMAYFMLAGYTVIAAVGNSLAPRLSRHWVVAPLLYRRLAARIGSVAFAIGCLNTLGALLFGKKILTSVYRAEYAGHNSVFVILMAATAFYYCGSILGFAVTAARRLWSYAIAYSSVPLICLIMAQLLVPKYGLNGAALAVLVASGLGALAPVLVISRALVKRRSDDLYAAG